MKGGVFVCFTLAGYKWPCQRSWYLALAKPHFWKLACCIWTLFLETSKRIIRQRQRRCWMCFKTMVFGSCEALPLAARLLPMKVVIAHKHHHTGNWTRSKPKFSSALLMPDSKSSTFWLCFRLLRNNRAEDVIEKERQIRWQRERVRETEREREKKRETEIYLYIYIHTYVYIYRERKRLKAPTAFRSISGFTLPSVYHNNSP